MRKILKFLIPCTCLIIAIVCVNRIGYASNKSKETPESVALKDYQHGKFISSENENHNENLTPTLVTTSTFSFPIYNTIQAQQILNINSKNISEVLLPTKEKLWFIMEGEQPEGLIVANDIEPIRMGGENRSKDLYEIYQTIKNNTEQIKEVAYFEFEGQGLFVVSHDTNKEIYLSKGAASILNLPAGQKISDDEVIQKMKDRIAKSS
ncbi:hypothetical protein [Bacillus gaemokensis]|uniref:Uncharacterized protein n=1 Tax=Bacillus gaemokensis TaxID=574375 RepID=A0A073K7A8_9BACI|nr:hypothetical protein [Bacillus gaemokensis]KEK22420.1 hypothetical protein BAGA_19250 [Bacillus gaemokensis]KYG25916.1 hypothetical protein AZF08_17985 [Bacillus gaemokensis]